jgi:hypothetical protein
MGAVGLIVVLAAILLASFATTSTWTPPLLILVSATGMLGAFFSSLTRLYDIDQLSVALITPTISQLGGRYLAMYSLMPPIIGAIAAVVIYVVFLAGMVGGGGLLPQMGCIDGEKWIHFSACCAALARRKHRITARFLCGRLPQDSPNGWCRTRYSPWSRNCRRTTSKRSPD